MNRAILKDLLKKFNIGGSFYIEESIPEKKLKNAIDKYKVPFNESVIGLIDTTLFGSAKEGLAFGLKGLYWHELMNDPQKINYDDLSKKYIAATGDTSITLLEKDLKIDINIGGSNSSPIIFINLLNEIIKNYKGVTLSIDEVIDSIGVVNEIRSFLKTLSEEDKTWLISTLTPLSDTCNATDFFSLLKSFQWANGSTEQFWNKLFSIIDRNQRKKILLSLSYLLKNIKCNQNEDSKNINIILFDSEAGLLIFYDDRVIYYKVNSEIFTWWYKNLSDISMIKGDDEQEVNSLFLTAKANNDFPITPFLQVKHIITDNQSTELIETISDNLITDRRKLNQVLIIRDDMGCITTEQNTLIYWLKLEYDTGNWSVKEIEYDNIETIFLESKHIKNFARFITSDSYFDFDHLSEFERKILFDFRDDIERLANRKMFHAYGVKLDERYWLYEFPTIIELVAASRIVDEEETIKGMLIANTANIKGTDLLKKFGLNALSVGASIALQGGGGGVEGGIKKSAQEVYDSLKQSSKYITSKLKGKDYSKEPFIIITSNKLTYYSKGQTFHYNLMKDIPFIFEEDDTYKEAINIYDYKNGKKGSILIKNCNKHMVEIGKENMQSLMNTKR